MYVAPATGTGLAAGAYALGLSWQVVAGFALVSVALMAYSTVCLLEGELANSRPVRFARWLWRLPR